MQTASCGRLRQWDRRSGLLLLPSLFRRISLRSFCVSYYVLRNQQDTRNIATFAAEIDPTIWIAIVSNGM
jgi:hypothetical protein